jgi:glycosyltransferase involved in cell wall biosynthesis
LKKVLIISPHFPPINAADMHRVRHMLNYLPLHGWNAEVIAVEPRYIEAYSVDELLLQTIPSDTIVHHVKAWKSQRTRKFGLGSVSMRSYFYIKEKVNEILREKNIDLIFFSTTAFHVMALGPYWKKKFDIPFVLDIQDPWRSDYYLDKPKNQRPPKFWISYTIDKVLEKRTVPFADGIISVSENYINTFKCRYNNLKSICKVIPFAIDELDFDIVSKNNIDSIIDFDKNKINIVYIGRGGHDLNFAVDVFFKGLCKFKEMKFSEFAKIKCYFIGTSYAPSGTGLKTIYPIAERYGLENQVIEITDRLPYFSTLSLLKLADVLFVPGSIDEGYTASKIYPYVLSNKPMISIFNENSSVVGLLNDCTFSSVITFSNESKSQEVLVEKVLSALIDQLENIGVKMAYNQVEFKKYLAKSMTKNVVSVFDSVCN